MKHLAILLLALSLLRCGPAAAQVPAPPTAIPWETVADAIELAAPAPATCHARGPLPDSSPSCTPGATNPAVTQDVTAITICQPGWTATVRPPVAYTNRVKAERMRAYGMPVSAMGDTELDHLIPLALGGDPRSVANLWPEAAEPRPGFHEKDIVERHLQLAACAGRISLVEAQHGIATDWTAFLSQATERGLLSTEFDPEGEP